VVRPRLMMEPGVFGGIFWAAVFFGRLVGSALQ